MSEVMLTPEEQQRADRIKLICNAAYRTIQEHDRTEEMAMTVVVMLMGELIGKFPPETWEHVLTEMADIIRSNLRRKAH